MLSIRPRTRPAVSGITGQIGSSGLPDQPGIDCLDRHVAECRIDIGTERRFPRVQALRRTPAGPVCGDVARGTFLKGDRRGGRYLALVAFDTARLDRVYADRDQPAGLDRFLSRLSERKELGRAEPHVAPTAGELVPQDPRFGASGTHLQVEPPTIGIQPRLSNRLH